MSIGCNQQAELEMSEVRQMDALMLLMKDSNVEEAERDRILKEFQSSNDNLKKKISNQKDRQVQKLVYMVTIRL